MSRAFVLLLMLVFTARASASDAPFMWQVQGPHTTHYLLGSVHLLPESVYPLPQALEQAYAKTAALVLETDPAALAAPATQSLMLKEGLANEGLSADIAPALYERVRQHAQTAGLPPAVCDRFKAWFCALTLGVIEFQRAGMDPGFGLDHHFYKRAMADARPIAWVEEPQVQLALFAGMSEPMAEQFLSSALDDLSRPDLRPAALVKLWRDNDTATLTTLIEATRADFPDTHERLLTDRNRAWIESLVALLDGQTAQLIVVGAAHLVGRDSVVALLRGRGYAVNAVAETP